METSSNNETDKWQTNKSLAQTNLHLLEQEVLSDITFEVGSNRTQVRAHKCILASRSPVFYAMFCGPLAESSKAISVPDTEADIFKTLLRFLYTEDCSLSGESVMALLYAAKKYEASALVGRCTEFLRNNIDTENVCIVLQQAVAFDEQELIKRCLTYISLHGEEIFKSSDCVSLSKEALKLILQSDNLTVAEKIIYEMCVEWAKHQCQQDAVNESDANIRQKLGNLVYLIRFPTMSAADFTAVVSMSSILTDKEKVAVFQTFIDKNLHQDIFPSSPRFPVFEPAAVFDRFKEIKSCWFHNGQPNAISFTTSQDVKLTYVSLFLPIRAGAINGKLEIADDNHVIESRYIRLSFDQDKKFKLVSLTVPVELIANTRYHIIQTCDGTQTYFGCSGVKDVINGDVKVTFSISSKNLCGTNDETQGQIHGLQFE